MSEFKRAAGQAIRARRGAVSQADLAAEMVALGYENWSQTTVWAIENGTRWINVEEAAVLARIFGVTLDELLDEPQARLDRCMQDLQVEGLAFLAAVKRLERAQRQMTSVAVEAGVKTSDERLNPLVRIFATTAADGIAALALSEDPGILGIAASIAEDVPARRSRATAPPHQD